MRLPNIIFLLISSFLITQVHYGITVVGSDLLGPSIEKNLKQYAEAEGITLDFNFEGSYQSEEKVAEGSADLAFITAIDSSKLTNPDLDYYPLAFQVMTILVQENNPLREINYAQISSIFRMGGQFNNWGSLIDDSTWSSRKIGVGALNYENSLSVEIFKSVVMPGSALKENIRYFQSESDMVQSLSDDNTLIALYPSIIEDPLLRTLAVSESNQTQAYSPTIDNIYFGDYPFRLPFYVIMKKGESSPELLKIAQFIFSKQIALALFDSKWVPLPDSERMSYQDSLK